MGKRGNKNNEHSLQKKAAILLIIFICLILLNSYLLLFKSKIVPTGRATTVAGMATFSILSQPAIIIDSPQNITSEFWFCS
jgi:hypothetical protein